MCSAKNHLDFYRLELKWVTVEALVSWTSPAGKMIDIILRLVRWIAYEVFLDSLKASLDKFGNFIPIRVQMIRDLAYPKSKFNEVKFNDCGDPIEITKYQEPLKDAVISKYRYVYEYW